jgi:hypothetical protein
MLSNSFAQNVSFPLIGSWREVEYHGNNGATDYMRKIENGRILIFENNNVVKDGNGNNGIYKINGDSLQILLPKNGRFYRFYYEKSNLNRIGLSPVTEKYEIICDEGCSEVYERFCSVKIPNTKIIRGFILDNAEYTRTKVPVISANIKVKGIETQTQSDKDGKFEIEAKEGDTLIVSGFGIKTVEILITKKECYKVDLNSNMFEPLMGGKHGRKYKRQQRKIERSMELKIKNGFYDCPIE